MGFLSQSNRFVQMFRRMRAGTRWWGHLCSEARRKVFLVDYSPIYTRTRVGLEFMSVLETVTWNKRSYMFMLGSGKQVAPRSSRYWPEITVPWKIADNYFRNPLDVGMLKLLKLPGPMKTWSVDRILGSRRNTVLQINCEIVSFLISEKKLMLATPQM